MLEKHPFNQARRVVTDYLSGFVTTIYDHNTRKSKDVTAFIIIRVCQIHYCFGGTHYFHSFVHHPDPCFRPSEIIHPTKHDGWSLTTRPGLSRQAMITTRETQRCHHIRSNLGMSFSLMLWRYPLFLLFCPSPRSLFSSV